MLSSDGAGARTALLAGALFAALFFSAGVQMAYLPVWFAARGLSETEIAIVLALPIAVRIFSTPAISFHADRTGQRTRVMHFLAIGALGAVVLLAVAEGFWAILGVMLLHASLWTAVMPLSEAFAMQGVRMHGLDYGRMRLWGSLAFIAAGLVGGWLLGQFGAGSVMPMLISAAVLLLLVTTVLVRTDKKGAADDPGDADGLSTDVSSAPNAGASTPGAVASPISGLSEAFHLLSRPAVLLLFLSSGLGQASHAVYYAFGTLHWQSAGIPAALIGVLWGIGVAAEVVLFAVSRRVIARVGALVLLIVGVSAGLLRWPLMAADLPFAALVAIQLLHGATFGATHLAAMHLIADMAGDRLSATAQGVHNTLAAGLFMAGSIMVAGLLYRAFDGAAYLGMAVVSAVALIFAVLLARTLSVASADGAAQPHSAGEGG
ncbi:MAG: MFS transporter [Pseudomonadota bacterium]